MKYLDIKIQIKNLKINMYLDTTEVTLAALSRTELFTLLENLFSWGQYYKQFKPNVVEYDTIQNKIKAVKRKINPDDKN